MKKKQISLAEKNKVFFGLGTVGRDMFYAFESNTLLYFLSDVLSLPKATFLIVSMVLSVLRILDAVNDPITGFFIDKIHTKWGKFKPAILVGGVTSALFFLVLFANIGKGFAYIVIFGAAYVLWDISYGLNDIAYWTLLPALTTDQKLREKYGAFAKICANVGMYIVMVGYQPITSALGDTPKVWFFTALAITALYLAFLCFPLFGVKENREYREEKEKTTLRDLIHAIAGNDQLLWTTLAMALFMLGYCTTTGFALYYMKYVFGNADMYIYLAAACGVAQLGALIVFPKISEKMSRKNLYTLGTLLVIVGYLVFFFAEISIFLIAAAAVLLFIGQAFIQLLMLMFLADTIEYGEWKLGKRSEAVTFSIQPFINKIGGALSTALISGTLILTHIKTDESNAEVTALSTGEMTIFKIAMLAIPLLCIVSGYFICLAKYKIDAVTYDRILTDLRVRHDESSEE